MEKSKFLEYLREVGGVIDRKTVLNELISERLVGIIGGIREGIEKDSRYSLLENDGLTTKIFTPGLDGGLWQLLGRKDINPIIHPSSLTLSPAKINQERAGLQFFDLKKENNNEIYSTVDPATAVELLAELYEGRSVGKNPLFLPGIESFSGVVKLINQKRQEIISSGMDTISDTTKTTVPFQQEFVSGIVIFILPGTVFRVKNNETGSYNWLVPAVRTYPTGRTQSDYTHGFYNLTIGDTINHKLVVVGLEIPELPPSGE